MRERRRLLRMVEEGRLSPEEALALWQALPPEKTSQAPAADPTAETRPEASRPLLEQGFLPRWARILPWAMSGVGALCVGGALGAVFLGGAGWATTLLCWTPLGLLGPVALALAWTAWRGVWVMFELQNQPGEAPQRLRFTFPLPLGWIPWALRLARPWVGAHLPLEGKHMRHLIQVLRDEPLWLTVDDEDGTQVRVWLGNLRPSAF